MSSLNFLFRNKRISVKGPDFTDAAFKVVNLTTGHSVEYEMPGNMTSDFSYDKRYKEESERSMTIDVSVGLKYERDTWQFSHYLDGASWDYTAGKSQGIKGQLGRINFRISVGRYEGDIKSFIANAYDTYLNGPDGENTEVRKIAVEEGHSMNELSCLLIEPPPSFAVRDINGVDCLYWVVEKEFSERTFTYFLYPLDDRHYISFRFYHYFSAGSEEEYLQMEQIVQMDIDRFLNQIFIRRS